jgi:hypothetical protein
MGELPYIDAHSLTVNASSDRVWEETAQVTRGWVGHTFPRSGIAGAVGPLFARPLGASNVESPPPGPGVPEAMVGFRVARAERPSLIALEGEHRFSRYALTFRIEPAESSSCIVTAETRAVFPGAPAVCTEKSHDRHRHPRQSRPSPAVVDQAPG